MKLVSANDREIRLQGRRQFVRGGPLDPALLVSLLLYQVRCGPRRGYARMLEAFWDEAHSFGLELPTAQAPTKQAFSQARHRLPAQVVRELLHAASDRFDEAHGGTLRWRGRRLLAVDGARRTVQASEELRYEFSGSPGAHYPQVHLTTLFDVLAKVPLDVEVGPYGTDERRALSKVLDRTREGDVLVLDSGYPGFDVFAMLIESGLDFICRVPATGSFAAAERFAASGASDVDLILEPPASSVLRGGDPIRLRAVRVERLDGECWILLTTLPRGEFPAEAIAEAYTLRWQVEEYYKLISSEYFGQGMLHSRSADGVRQEIYAQMLFVAITRHLAAAAARHCDVPYEELSQKAAILAVGDHLTRLVLHRPSEAARDDLERLLRRIARARERPRATRSCPRRSFLPQRRWGPNGRRGKR